MRTVLPIVGVAVVVTTVAAQQPSGLDAPVGLLRLPATPQSCDARGMARTIGQAAKMPIGFEDLPACSMGTYPPGVLPRDLKTYAGETGIIGQLSVREAFDRLTTMLPAFEWRDVDGVATVRPKGAWNDKSDLLNLQAHPVQAAGGLFEAVSLVLFNRPSAQDTKSFSLNFHGGTLMDALDAVVKGARAESWMAITIEHPTNWPSSSSPVAVVAVQMPHAGPATFLICSAKDLDAYAAR